jgi:hypothetical protein
MGFTQYNSIVFEKTNHIELELSLKSFGILSKANTMNLRKVPELNNVLELKKELESTSNSPNSVPKTAKSFGYSSQDYLSY